MLYSTGKLHYEYSASYGYKLAVPVDSEISRYYRKLIPKIYNIKPQKYESHISVIRKENIVNVDLWGRYENKTIEFGYEHLVYNDETYWWLRVTCQELCSIRMELGLEPYSVYARPPDGVDFFHITIGNTKHK